MLRSHDFADSARISFDFGPSTSPLHSTYTVMARPFTAQILETLQEAKYWPLHDLVSTRGLHLVSRSPSPVFHTDCYFNATFNEQLVEALRLLQEQMKLRSQLNGDEADQSRVSHTPPELRALHQSEKELNLRDFNYNMFAPTPRTERIYTPRSTESVQT
jgi:hypothetical protein